MDDFSMLGPGNQQLPVLNIRPCTPLLFVPIAKSWAFKLLLCDYPPASEQTNSMCFLRPQGLSPYCTVGETEAQRGKSNYPRPQLS